MTKKQAFFWPQISSKFNSTWIQFMPNEDIMLSQET